MARISGNRFIAEYLAHIGTSHFFYVPVLFPPAMKEMTQLGITPIVAHSEKAAAYMADGYARASGKVGFCGSQAIGGSNLAAGLRDALMARSPVVAITGGPTSDTRHRLLYQDIDDIPVYAALTKGSATIDKAERIPDLLRQAVRLATSGSPGPSHLQMAGFWGAAGMSEIDADPTIGGPAGHVAELRPRADAVLVSTAAVQLQSARKPVIIAGGGVTLSGAGAALLAFAEAAAIPVATSMGAKACFPEASALSLGVVGDYARECANAAVSEADCVLFVGSATGSMVTRNWTLPSADASIIHIDIDPAQIGRNHPDPLPLWGDARSVLEQLTAEIPNLSKPDRGDWLARIAELKADWRTHADEVELSDAVPMRPERLVRLLSDALPDDALLVVDTGHSAGWIARHISLRTPDQAIIRAAGSLGWAFPAALGAKCANLDRPVIAFAGDGGFLYHLPELETAVRYGINVVTIVNNNNALNQEKFLWGDDPAFAKNWRFHDMDYAAVARTFGALGIAVTEPGEFIPALVEALASGRPAVIDVRTDIDAVVPPSWGPGSGQPYSGGGSAGH